MHIHHHLAFIVAAASLALAACPEDAATTPAADVSTPDATGDAAADATADAAPADGEADALPDAAADGATDGSGPDATVDAVNDGTMTDTMVDADTPAPDVPAPTCGAIVTFEDGKTPTAIVHVATDGADTPACGPEATPCATIEHAAGLAQAGTSIRIHAGTYGGGAYIADLQGTAENPIWLGGAPGEAPPVFDGGGQAMQLVRARYLIVHDLEVTGSTNNGINADDGADYDNPEAARHLVFRNLYIHDVGSGGNQDCLKLSGIDDHFVLDSVFERCGGGGSGSGIDHVGCHQGLIARNTFEDMGNSGSGVQAKGGCVDIEIRNNLFLDAGQRGVNMGGSTGFEFFRPSLSETAPNTEASDIRVLGNVFVGGVAPFAYVGCVDCVAANNTIIYPENWVTRILQETTSTATYDFLPASNGYFVNNLVFFDRSQISTWVNVGGNTAADTFVFSNNLWYAVDNPTNSDPGSGLPTAEADTIAGIDPLLVNPENGDYSLQPGSPAEGAGVGGSWVPAADMTGACYGAPPAIGAYSAN